jgi:hypothetical protein
MEAAFQGNIRAFKPRFAKDKEFPLITKGNEAR